MCGGEHFVDFSWYLLYNGSDLEIGFSGMRA